MILDYLLLVPAGILVMTAIVSRVKKHAVVSCHDTIPIPVLVIAMKNVRFTFRLPCVML